MDRLQLELFPLIVICGVCGAGTLFFTGSLFVVGYKIHGVLLDILLEIRRALVKDASNVKIVQGGSITYPNAAGLTEEQLNAVRRSMKDLTKRREAEPETTTEEPGKPVATLEIVRRFIYASSELIPETTLYLVEIPEGEEGADSSYRFRIASDVENLDSIRGRIGTVHDIRRFANDCLEFPSDTPVYYSAHGRGLFVRDTRPAGPSQALPPAGEGKEHSAAHWVAAASPALRNPPTNRAGSGVVKRRK